MISKEAEIIIAGHLGRPKGQYVQELSSSNLDYYFHGFFKDYPYKLLENLRFDSREKENNMDFAKELASEAEIYVNESFGTSHREHASMVGVPKLIPGYAGFHLEKEISVLKNLLVTPKRPFIAIVGGAKIETKKPVIDKMLEIADGVLVGGRIGLDWSEPVPENLFLPVDYARDEKDIGTKTINLFSELISTAKTIIWSGPMGMFEDIEFVQGTKSVARSIVESPAFSVVGGGDTISALDHFGYLNKMNFISSGGGAMLEFLVKGTLPALEVLE